MALQGCFRAGITDDVTGNEGAMKRKLGRGLGFRVCRETTAVSLCSKSRSHETPKTLSLRAPRYGQGPSPCP